MSAEYFLNEKRKFPRLKINIVVTLQVDKPLYSRVLIKREGIADVEATTIDLSENGMGILTDYDIPVSTILSIEFMLYKADNKSNFTLYKLIKLKGIVKSNILLKENKRRLGICFTEINEADKYEIANFVKRGIAL